MQNYYEVLGVDQNATQADIQQAYRELAKRYHPDRNPTDAESATRTMQLINEAYNTLKDPVKRSEYDMDLALSTRQQDVFDSATTSAEAESTDEEFYIPECRCERCGRVDSTLRATIFLWVLGLLVVTIRRGWGGVLCSRCRLKYSVLFNLEVWLFGWWGFPWGVIFSIGALLRNSVGGIQPKDANAALLALVSYQLFCQGRYAEALDAGLRSLELQPNEELQAFLEGIRSYTQSQKTYTAKTDKGGILLANAVLAAFFYFMVSYAFYRAETMSSDSAPEATTSHGLVLKTIPDAEENLELIGESRRKCEEAFREISKHLEQRMPIARVTREANRVVYLYNVDYAEFDSVLIGSHRETIQHALQEAQGYTKTLKEMASSASPEERAGVLSALEKELSFMAAAYFNARVLESGARIFGGLTQSGRIPEGELGMLEDAKNEYYVGKWLKDNGYSSRFDELLVLLKAIDNDIKTSEQIEHTLSELDKQIKADQEAILQMQSKLDLLYASGRFGAYNSLVDQHNSLVRRYKRNIAAFNNKVGMANRTKARLEQEIAKAGKAFNDCLDQKMIFRWFSNNEASSAEGLMH